MTGMVLTRARLRRDAQVAAIAPLLMPENDDARALAAHRLIWSLMPPDAGATRDFLWREEAPGRFLVLAARPPEPSVLFDVDPPKPFQPELEPGDRLAFLLRANPTMTLFQRGTRGKRVDVVMHALHAVPQAERAAARPGIVRSAGAAWLDRMATQHGFKLVAEGLGVDGYETRRIARTGKPPAAFATLDFQGEIIVTDPAMFVPALCSGFGRARAFGCGLMLIRRAR